MPKQHSIYLNRHFKMYVIFIYAIKSYIYLSPRNLKINAGNKRRKPLTQKDYDIELSEHR